jgi:hypothetical protein
VRLVNATRADRDTVERQLGLTRSSFDREPDVVVQFVEGLRSGDLRYVEPGRIAYDDESLVLLREGRRNLRTRVMMDDRGVTEIVCEHGVPAIPLLAHLVNQAALTRGFVAVHASAINYRGLGILMPAWAHGGKTTGLAAFMAHGAQYVGDEWIFIGPGGESMYGAAHPVNLHDWHLAQLPVTGALERARRALVRHAARAVPSQRIEAAVRRRLDREVDPVSVFGADRVRLSSPLDVVMLMVRHDAESIRVEACDPASMINRVEAATASEGLAFRSVALARDFAQGRRSEPPADRFRDRRALLTQALADKPAFVVYHPAECRLEALAEAMVTHCNLFAFGGGAGARAAGRAKPATRASSADGARDGGDRRADEPGPAAPWSVHGVGGDR